MESTDGGGSEPKLSDIVAGAVAMSTGQMVRNQIVSGLG